VGLPEHLTRHLLTMAELNRSGRYDRIAEGVERMTGRPAMSVREFVSLHADEFDMRRSEGVESGVLEALGRDPTTFAEFARNYAPIFR
jgi:hypothetical protein